MSTRRIETTLPAVNGGCNYGLVVEKSPIYSYENGKRVSDNPIGVRLTLALQNARLTHLVVKFDKDPIPQLTDEQIVEACAACKFIYTQVPDCVVVLYNSENGIGMTATAQTAQLINSK